MLLAELLYKTLSKISKFEIFSDFEMICEILDFVHVLTARIEINFSHIKSLSKFI